MFNISSMYYQYRYMYYQDYISLHIPVGWTYCAIYSSVLTMACVKWKCCAERIKVVDVVVLSYVKPSQDDWTDTLSRIKADIFFKLLT